MDELNKSMEQYYGMISAADEANRSWSAEQAQKQMEFQERMSNSAHQREVEDLKKAGLNPVLSAGGAGATTGSGAMASTNGNNIDALYGLVSQAFKAQIENAKAEQASAKAMSGASGRASSVFGDGILDSLADFVKRKTGISPEHLKDALSSADKFIKNAYDKVTGFFGPFSGEGEALASILSSSVDDRPLSERIDDVQNSLKALGFTSARPVIEDDSSLRSAISDAISKIDTAIIDKKNSKYSKKSKLKK